MTLPAAKSGSPAPNSLELSGALQEMERLIKAAKSEEEKTAVKAHLAAEIQKAVTRMSGQSLAELAGLAGETDGDQPQALYRELSPSAPFPINSLPTVLRDAADAIHQRIQAPFAICGQSVLAAATVSVQGFADIQLPMGARRPISNFFVTIAASGERKTSADQLALEPLRYREQDLRIQYAQQITDHEIELEAWEQQRKVELRKNTNLQGKEKALRELGAKPEAPRTPILTCPEPTFEGLTRLFVHGYPSLGLFSAEGGQFLGGHAMNRDNRLKTAAALSGLWDGEPIKRVRAGEGAHNLSGRRLSIHLLMQSQVASDLFSDPLLKDQGTLSRILIAAPPPAAGSRFWRELDPECDKVLAYYTQHFLAILKRPLPLVEGTSKELSPRLIRMSRTARKLWIKFADHLEGRIGPGAELEPIRDFANKLPEHAARLGTVIAMAQDPDQAELSGEDMARGIELAKFYANEALRLHETGTTDPDLLLAQRLCGWLNSTWEEDLISLPDIYQKGPRPIRDKATAKRVVGILEDHGWLHSLRGPADVAGSRRREVWQIVRVKR